MRWHVSEFWQGWIELGAWAIAIVWCTRAAEMIRHLPEVADLTLPDWAIAPETTPTLLVVVPACNEAESIAATMDALLAADYPSLFVVAVDDRSTDATGAILDEYAALHPQRIGVLHIAELPEGWLGKTHALQAAVDATESEFVLFTDADVLFSPSILRRTIAFAQAEEADHVVVLPTPQVKSRGEGILLGFCQMLGFWGTRPWKVADAKARDSIGIGGCNLLRRAALEEIGGLAPQRLAVVEDITLGQRIKSAGLRQRMAFAPEFVLVHWAKGARGVVRAMTKNLYAVFGFKPWLLGGMMLGIGVFFLAPIAGLAWTGTMVPALLVMLGVASMYRVLGEISRIDARYGWLYPVGAAMFLYAMARSFVVALWRGGVEWRGTVYPLSELRAGNDPFQWRREAEERRDRARRVRPSRVRRLVDRWKG